MIDWPNAGGGRAQHEPALSHLEISPGKELECATWGLPPNRAPTILLLHEGLGCVRLWRDFPARLAAATGCGVFAYSRLGYGNSSSITLPLPITRMADESRDVLPCLIEAIAPRRLVLIGHSDGGTIAAHYLAGETVAALKGVVLMAPHFFCEPSNIAAIRATSAAFGEGDLRARLAKYHADVDGAFHGWAATWLDPAFARWDVRGEVQRWRHPVLFIQGRDDPYGSEGQADAAAASPFAEVCWLENCAHSPHLQQPVETLAMISGFVARVVGDAG